MHSTIRSERLDLISLTPQFMRASLDGDVTRAQELVPFALPAGWPDCIEPDGHDCSNLLSLRLSQLEASPELQPWLLRGIMLRSTREMVGYVGFHAAPGHECLEAYSPGAVEFGYTVFLPHRRRGYAREASRALMNWAQRSHGVTRFVVCISPTNVASMSLAASLGFVRIGSHVDEKDGPEDILECDLAAENEA